MVSVHGSKRLQGGAVKMLNCVVRVLAAADVTLLLHEKVSRLVNIMVHRLNKEGVRIPLY